MERGDRDGGALIVGTGIGGNDFREGSFKRLSGRIFQAFASVGRFGQASSRFAVRFGYDRVSVLVGLIDRSSHEIFPKGDVRSVRAAERDGKDFENSFGILKNRPEARRVGRILGVSSVGKYDRQGGGVGWRIPACREPFAKRFAHGEKIRSDRIRVPARDSREERHERVDVARLRNGFVGFS